MNNRRLPTSLAKLLDEIATDIGCPSFYLFGGAALDLLIDPNASIADFDIAIEGRSEVLAQCIRQRLIERGFSIEIANLFFEVNWREPVTIIKAVRDGRTLDIALIEVFTLGQFDVESLFWEYPSKVSRDPYDALGAIERRRLKPLRELNAENPFLLAGRFLKLMRKYQLPSSDPLHNGIATELGRLCDMPLRVSNEFQRSFPPALALGSAMSFIFESKDRCEALSFLVKSSLLSSIMPELEGVLFQGDNVREGSLLRAIGGATSVEEFEEVLVSSVPQEGWNAFADRLAHREE